ncbi:hypothetical protein AVEN_129229-1 [Araneus ventricosus]|uniref:Uncharacterized protein n=1 Tax=Araneus ventricosus TaxID=182803 RepID=A0A4Y2HFV5_ARAVE|nr:hypothetical protein AVEN_34295-1 [Araneus ventricosus]GBM64187.1 hypothetical protein AVEN_129229-1 [Araneus ventricosus]
MHREGAVSSHPFTLVGVCCWSKSSSASLCTGCEEYSSTEIQPLNDALRGRRISTEQELQDVAHQCSVAQTTLLILRNNQVCGPRDYYPSYLSKFLLLILLDDMKLSIRFQSHIELQYDLVVAFYSNR